MVVTIFVDVGGGDVDVADLVHLAEGDAALSVHEAIVSSPTDLHRRLAVHCHTVAIRVN